jgi:hypothetical protein
MKHGGAILVTLTIWLALVSGTEAIDITLAEVQNGVAVIQGNKATKQATIFWESGNVGRTTNGGSFSFSGLVPEDCVGQLSIGADTISIALANCTSTVLATGQTTPFMANKNDGIVDPVAIDDDGTLKLGTPLRYRDNGDGTVTDLNTGLMWEKKVEGSGCLRCVGDEFYRWSIGLEDGSQKSIWDWLDELNASNFAGYSDWRMPNVRELHSIVHYGCPAHRSTGPSARQQSHTGRLLHAAASPVSTTPFTWTSSPAKCVSSLS